MLDVTCVTFGGMLVGIALALIAGTCAGAVAGFSFAERQIARERLETERESEELAGMARAAFRLR